MGDSIIKPRKLAMTIAASGTTSGAVDTKGYQITGIEIPSAMTGTALTFTVLSGDGSAYVPLYDKTNTAYSVLIPTNRAQKVTLPPADFCDIDSIKAVSNGTESVARTLYLWVRPV
jgi:hypothetical protein